MISFARRNVTNLTPRLSRVIRSHFGLIFILTATACSAFALKHVSNASVISGATVQILPTPQFNPNDFASFKDLPVSEVKTLTPPDSRGHVYLIPQYHQNASATSADSLNDQSYLAQQEIYTILSQLSQHTSLQNVLVEGELSGPVPKEKISQLSQTLSLHKTLKTQTKRILQKLDGSAPDNDQLKSALTQTLEQIDRTLILKGAGQIIAARQPDINLFGVEEADTLAAGKEIIRNYVYLSDRLATVTSPAQSNPQTIARAAGSSPSNQLIRLIQLASQKKAPSLNSLLNNISARASLNHDSETVQLCADSQKTLSALEQSYTTDSAASDTSPDRSQNPYAHVTDEQTLRQHMSETQDQIQTTIINRRNQETARNTANILSQTSDHSGILLFGKSHTEGLTQELLNQNLTVTIITPNAVTN